MKKERGDIKEGIAEAFKRKEWVKVELKDDALYYRLIINEV